MKRLDELVKALREGDSAEQISAARELEALGPSALAALPHVLDCLPTAGPHLQKALLGALVGFGPRVLPEITRRVQEAPEPARTALHNAEHHVAERLDVLLERQTRLRNWTTWASGLLGSTLLRLFAGSQLYKKAQDLWDATSATLRGEKVDSLEPKARDFLAALLSRVTRMSVVALLVILAQPAMLLMQTALLSAQNEKLDRQNSLMAAEQSVHLRRLFTPEVDDRFGYLSLSVPKWNYQQRISGLMAAGLGAAQPELIAPLLQSLMRDPDPRISYAALVASRELLSHEREEVRAAFARRLNPALPDIVERLRSKKGDAHREVLKSLPPIGVDAVPAVLAHLPALDLDAASFLWEFVEGAPGAYAFILDEIAKTNALLERPGSGSEDSAMVEVERLRFETAIGTIAPSVLRHEAFHPYLRATMKDLEAATHARAVYQLLARGSVWAKPFVPEVLKSLEKASGPFLRADMLRALVVSETPSDETFELLTNELGNPSSLVWAAAKETLVKMSLTPQQEEALLHRYETTQERSHRLMLLDAIEARKAARTSTQMTP